MSLSAEIQQRAHELGIAHELDALPPCPYCGQATTVINLTVKARATLVCHTYGCDGQGGFIIPLSEGRRPILSRLQLRILIEVRDAQRPIVASTLHRSETRHRTAIRELVGRGLLTYHPPPPGTKIGGMYAITRTGLRALYCHQGDRGQPPP